MIRHLSLPLPTESFIDPLERERELACRYCSVSSLQQTRICFERERKNCRRRLKIMPGSRVRALPWHVRAHTCVDRRRLVIVGIVSARYHFPAGAKVGPTFCRRSPSDMYKRAGRLTEPPPPPASLSLPCLSSSAGQDDEAECGSAGGIGRRHRLSSSESSSCLCPQEELDEDGGSRSISQWWKNNRVFGVHESFLTNPSQGSSSLDRRRRPSLLDERTSVGAENVRGD